jgi:DNA-binding LytR/AlgR family response regulator
LRRTPTLAELLPVYAHVALIAGGVTLVFWFVSRGEREVARPAPVDIPPAPLPVADDGRTTVRFVDRLPPHLGRELLALEMEDHYVRAHTPSGSALVLMRMRDAVAELDGMEGLQVHRSWWVARAAVEGEVQDGRNVRLKLKSGLEAPVARNSVPALRAAGWLR